MQRIATLQFLNREHVLVFRGQKSDYKNKQKNSTLKPELFRPERGHKENPSAEVIRDRFNLLARAEESLVNRYAGGAHKGQDRIKRQRVLRWSLLQHYDVCPTPVLDVTQSIRVAASFASDGTDPGDFGYVYVLGIPNISGAITASAEAGLQVIRLSSVCPPTALRPHIQEGFLLAEYPQMEAASQKENYPAHEIDFGRRLVAKFKFDPQQFWTDPVFPRLGHEALYSNTNDPMYDLTQLIVAELAGH